WPISDVRAERRERCPLRGLRLFAAEGAAHASHLDRDRGGRLVEHVRDHVLQLARMLRRRIDQHVAFARNGEAYLPFKIEMLLPADLERAGELPGARGQRRS